MNKEESLAFLECCINSIENATPKEVERLKELYDKNCVKTDAFPDFEFIFPSDSNVYFHKTVETMKIEIPKKDFKIDGNKESWDYNVEGVTTSNEQSGANLSFAA